MVQYKLTIKESRNSSASLLTHSLEATANSQFFLAFSVVQGNFRNADKGFWYCITANKLSFALQAERRKKNNCSRLKYHFFATCLSFFLYAAYPAALFPQKAQATSDVCESRATGSMFSTLVSHQFPIKCQRLMDNITHAQTAKKKEACQLYMLKLLLGHGTHSQIADPIQILV